LLKVNLKFLSTGFIQNYGDITRQKREKSESKTHFLKEKHNGHKAMVLE
jgi:hypothetical protein